MEPINKLLKSKANNEDWNPALRAVCDPALPGDSTLRQGCLQRAGLITTSASSACTR